MVDRGVVALDLVPTELIVPRLRVAGAVFALVGAVLGAVAAFLINPVVGRGLLQRRLPGLAANSNRQSGFSPEVDFASMRESSNRKPN